MLQRKNTASLPPGSMALIYARHTGNRQTHARKVLKHDPDGIRFVSTAHRKQSHLEQTVSVSLTDIFRESAEADPVILINGDRSCGKRDVVIGIVVLFAVSAAAGFLLGYFCFHWLSFAASGLILALTAAWILQAHGFWIVSGIAAIVACVTVNQFAFLMGCLVRMSREPTNNE